MSSVNRPIPSTAILPEAGVRPEMPPGSAPPFDGVPAPLRLAEVAQPGGDTRLRVSGYRGELTQRVYHRPDWSRFQMRRACSPSRAASNSSEKVSPSNEGFSASKASSGETVSDPADGIAIPDIHVLQLTLPLPPSANRLFRVGPYAGYATAEYRDWLRICAPMLREALGPEWETSTSSWWVVSGWLKLGKRHGDGPNYLKATLDLLTGSRMPVDGEEGPDGKLPQDKILKRKDGVWNDDKRVLLRNWTVVGINHPEPMLDLSVQETRYAPTNYAAKSKPKPRVKK